MNNKINSICFYIFLICLLIKPIQSFSIIKGDLLIKNITLIDVKNSLAKQGQYLLIKGDKILGISEDSMAYQAGQVIDGRGKFLMPGLWDMHTHNAWQKHFSNYYIANGVLGVRNMYTPVRMIRPLQDSIQKGLIRAPHFVSAGRVLQGVEPEFPDWLVVDSVNKIETALNTLKMEGSDFVNVASKLPRDVYFELMKEAKKRNMRVDGQLPMAVSALEASSAGQGSLEHLLGIPELCSNESLFKDKHDGDWFEAVLNEHDYGIMKVDTKLAEKNFSVLKRNNTYVCPTLVVWNNYFHPDVKMESEAAASKFPKEVLDYWSTSINIFREKDKVNRMMAERKYTNLQHVTHLLYKSGVPMLLGTDAKHPYCYPGFSIHKEMELLKECGIPDKEILKMATCNAAQFLGLENQYGDIKEGMQASLLVLSGNPLLSIGYVSNIEKVVLNGNLINKEDLEQMKK